MNAREKGLFNHKGRARVHRSVIAVYCKRGIIAVMNQQKGQCALGDARQLIKLKAFVFYYGGGNSVSRGFTLDIRIRQHLVQLSQVLQILLTVLFMLPASK